jgi:hypothetical protein
MQEIEIGKAGKIECQQGPKFKEAGLFLSGKILSVPGSL